MNYLQSHRIEFRALELKDLNLLYKVENDALGWHLSNTLTPWNTAVLKKYIENATEDIYTAKQLRLVAVEISNDRVIGFLDFFDFDPKNKRVGLGLMVIDETKRHQGYGTEMVLLALNMAFNLWDLHQVYVNILADNTSSISLFQKLGFEAVGVKKDWVYWKGVYQDELLYQKINI